MTRTSAKHSSRDFEAQLAASQRDFEAKFAAHARAVARLDRELNDARERNTEYLETLQSNEGRRSVFEEMIAALEGEVELSTHEVRQRLIEAQIARSQQSVERDWRSAVWSASRTTRATPAGSASWIV